MAACCLKRALRIPQAAVPLRAASCRWEHTTHAACRTIFICRMPQQHVNTPHMPLSHACCGAQLPSTPPDVK
eukprot:835526-Alexandrium_andersonii.AAC.1